MQTKFWWETKGKLFLGWRGRPCRGCGRPARRCPFGVPEELPAAPGSAKTRLRLRHLRFFFRGGRQFFGSVPKRGDRSPDTTVSGLTNL